MKLNDFIDKRRNELGISITQFLEDSDLEWSTLHNIRAGKGIRASTIQKLAKGLKCTAGDIQACLAEQENPLRNEAEKIDGFKGEQKKPKKAVSKPKKVEKKEKPILKAPELDEETVEKLTLIGKAVEGAVEEVVEEPVEEADPVNHPNHYTSGSVECIEAIEASMSSEQFKGYCKACVMKYVWRYQLKNGVEDLKKARWYLNKLIDHLEKRGSNK